MKTGCEARDQAGVKKGGSRTRLVFVLVALVTSGEARGEGLAADAEPPVARACAAWLVTGAPSGSEQPVACLACLRAVSTLSASGPSRRCSQSQSLALHLRARDASIFQRATRSDVLGGFDSVILNAYDIIFNGTVQQMIYVKQAFVHLVCYRITACILAACSLTIDKPSWAQRRTFCRTSVWKLRGAARIAFPTTTKRQLGKTVES